MIRDPRLLPEVAGSVCTISIEELELRLRKSIANIQDAGYAADGYMVGSLCEAVRLCREHVNTMRGAWRTDSPPVNRPFLALRDKGSWVVRWDEDEGYFNSVPGGYQCAVTRWMDIPEDPCRS